MEARSLRSGLRPYPKAVALYDTTATISQLDKSGNGIEITVTPSRKQDHQVTSDLVNINLIVFKVTSGQKKILANSKIATKLGMSAVLHQESEGHDLKMTVVPSEIQ